MVTVAGAAARHLRGLQPVAPGRAMCGPAATCRCAHADNFALHKLLVSAAGASVLVCDAGGDGDHGYFGELMGSTPATATSPDS
ncbi:MAG TPA: hypothetical protein VMK83_05265 [Gaiellaceae bacterium]|nr:hypothetical protein [Gaiellaceae bacterium]